VFAFKASVGCEPVVVFVPLQPFEAVQVVASFAVHCNVVDCPEVIEVDAADNVTVGAGGELAIFSP
jgi:hypothetical protein